MPDHGVTSRAAMAALIRRNAATHDYFFENLNDPQWLDALVSEKFFRDPQPAERGDDWVRYPFWAESRYLARIAALAPERVLAVALQIPRTDNVRVHEDLLRAANSMPGRLAARLTRHEVAWLQESSEHLMSLPGAVGALAAHLAREGELAAAFELLGEILRIRAAESQNGGRQDAVARVNEYEYARIIDAAWPDLVAVAPRRAFGFLVDRLSDVVRLGFAESEGRDSTSIWRPAVEEHEQNLDHSLLDTLVVLVRDQAVALADRGAEETAVVVEELGRGQWPVHERIALHVARVRGSADLVSGLLCDARFAFENAFWHEYGELLRERFGDLVSDDQRRVLAVLEAGESLVLSARLREGGVTEEDLERWNRRSRLRRYAVIASQLPEGILAKYEQLRQELGDPEQPTFLSYSTSWIGPTSPIGSEQLSGMSPRELVGWLCDWTPSLEPDAPSPEGLGRILQETVSASPTEFAAEALLFQGLDATYVRALISGLAGAVRGGTALSWKAVLELCAWVVAQPRGEGEAGDYDGSDPHWGWARKAVADLLGNGFTSGTATIPYELREWVWTLLSDLTSDPDPTAEHEERYGGDNMDPATLSINTTRGEAMHALFRYTLWVERALVERGSQDFVAPVAIPEAVAIIDAHLDVTRERSLAVRSVYGQWFGQVVRMDADWARELAPRVFPTGAAETQLFAAAWRSYVLFTRAYGDVFAIIENAYSRAIDLMDSEESARSTLVGDPQKRLGDHLLRLRIEGGVQSDQARDLFESFWNVASHELRRDVLRSAGWSLQRVQSLEPAIRERLMATWSWILAASSDDGAAALSGFGAWLRTESLDAMWLLEQALAVLNQNVVLEPDFAVFEALPRLASTEPVLAVEVLRRTILLSVDESATLGSLDEIRETLRIVRSTDVEQTDEILDLLGARGLTQLRDLRS